jgi:DNA-binding response OmpR family regulator
MKTILVVDDEERIRNVYVKILEREGFHMLSAATANDATELLLRNPVDLILLDINMIEVDGSILYEIAQTFHKNTKVIVSSVYPLEDQKTLIKDAADYYDKSDSIKVLIQKVNAIM